MSSEEAGVQAMIKEVSPLTFYTQYYCHCLKLSLARNSGSTHVYLPTCSRTNLVRLCKTRWVESVIFVLLAMSSLSVLLCLSLCMLYR